MGVEVGRSGSFLAATPSSLPWSNARCHGLSRVASPLWAPVAKARAWKVVKVQFSQKEANSSLDKEDIRRESASSRQYLSQLMKKQYGVGVLGITAVASAIGVFQSLLRPSKVKKTLTESDVRLQIEDKVQRTEQESLERPEIEEEEEASSEEEDVQEVSAATVVESEPLVDEVIPDMQEATVNESAKSAPSRVDFNITAQRDVELIQDYNEELRTNQVTQYDDSFEVPEVDEGTAEEQPSLESTPTDSGVVADVEQRGSYDQGEVENATSFLNGEHENAPDEVPSEMEAAKSTLTESEVAGSSSEKKKDETGEDARTIAADEVAETQDWLDDSLAEREEETHESEPVAAAAISEGLKANGTETGSSENGSVDLAEGKDTSQEETEKEALDSDTSAAMAAAEPARTVPADSYFPSNYPISAFEAKPKSTGQRRNGLANESMVETTEEVVAEEPAPPEEVVEAVTEEPAPPEEVVEAVTEEPAPPEEVEDIAGGLQPSADSETEIYEVQEVVSEGAAPAEDALTADETDKKEETGFFQQEDERAEDMTVQSDVSSKEETEESVSNGAPVVDAEVLPQAPVAPDEPSFAETVENGRPAAEVTPEVVEEATVAPDTSDDVFQGTSTQPVSEEAAQETTDVTQAEPVSEISSNGEKRVDEKQPANDFPSKKTETPERVVVSKDQSMYPPSYYRPESETPFRADKTEEGDPFLVPEEELEAASFAAAEGATPAIDVDSPNQKLKTKDNFAANLLLMGSALTVGFLLLRWVLAMVMPRPEPQIVPTQMAESSVTTTRRNYDDYDWVSSDGEESGSDDEANVNAGALGAEDDIDEEDSGNVADDEEDSP